MQGHAGVDGADLPNEQAAKRLVPKFQRHGFIGRDFYGLRRIVQGVASLGAGFLHDQRSPRFNIGDQDGSGAVGGEVAVAVAHNRAIAGGNKKLHVTERIAGHAVHLFHQQGAVFAVGKGQGNAILLFAGDIGSLRGGVDHIAVGRVDFLTDIGSGLQPGDDDIAVAGGVELPDDGAAAAAGAAKIADAEPGIDERRASVGVNFPNDQG